jgi:hypothetical protein
MDFTGRGYISEDDFLSSIVISRILASKTFILEDIKEFFKQENLFPHLTGQSHGGINYDKFKKIFFPKMFLIEESEESDEEKMAKRDKSILKVGLNDDQDREA